MPSRRDFLKGVAAASAGLFSSGRGLADAAMRSGQIGAPAGTDVEVREGLKAGEKIVAAGSFYLKTALLRERIGGE